MCLGKSLMCLKVVNKISLHFCGPAYQIYTDQFLERLQALQGRRSHGHQIQRWSPGGGGGMQAHGGNSAVEG